MIFIFVLQIGYGIFSGYLIGTQIQEEYEIMPKLLLGALAISLMTLFFGHILHVIIAYMIWLLLTVVVSELVKLLFKAY